MKLQSLFSLHFLSILSVSMTFCMRHLGSAVRLGTKNATQRAYHPLKTSSPSQLFSTATEVGSLGDGDVRSMSYTNAVIANFVQSMPPLATAEVVKILRASIEQHKVLPNVVRLKVPLLDKPAVMSVTTELDGTSTAEMPVSEGSAAAKHGNFSICGDTHGQFFDVMNIFSDDIGGFPSISNAYLFNGDFVDRGPHSIEVILTLLAIKLSNPTAMNLLRGNHESIQMNTMFGFTEELQKKYAKDSKALFWLFQELFCALPIAAVVEDQVFVVHGGVGPATAQMTLEELDLLNRFKEPSFKEDEEEGAAGGEGEGVLAKEFHSEGMSELLWSDPMQPDGFKGSQRGGGVTTFGADVTMYFLDNNNLKVIVRSHQVMMKGFEVQHGGRCATVFSAPDYCGMKNLGALMRFSGPEAMMQPKIVSFGPVSKINRENILD